MEQKTHSTWMLAAAGLMAATGFIHVVMGSPEYLTPMRATDLATIPKAGFTVIWHVITVMLFGCAAVLFWLRTHRNTALFVVTLGFLISSSAIFIGIGISDTGGIMDLPQWILLGGSAVLALVGWRK